MLLQIFSHIQNLLPFERSECRAAREQKLIGWIKRLQRFPCFKPFSVDRCNFLQRLLKNQCIIMILVILVLILFIQQMVVLMILLKLVNISFLLMINSDTFLSSYFTQFFITALVESLLILNKPILQY